jgi:hypothetical protein
MPINISDNERGKLAAMIRETVDTLQATKFTLDPLVTASASLATSRISSAFKRHGYLLQAALATAISTCPDFQTWNEVPCAHPLYKNGLKIDLFVFDKKKRLLEVFEIKRGGKHDSDAKKGIERRLQAAKDVSAQFCTSHGIQCSAVNANFSYK